MTRRRVVPEMIALLMVHTLSLTGDVTESPPWVSDNGDGTYTNPVLYADYSDPDVVRVGEDFFLVASSFNCVPGLPILHSRDLVNWTIVGHAITRLPSPEFDSPQHGNGVWAPSIRYHDGRFWIYYGDPDNGMYLITSEHAEGPWQDPVLVRKAKGWIDPCPLWDSDGTMYLVHAWARSRAGFNSVLTVHRMSPDGTHTIDEGATVFDGHVTQPTIEGPKFYRRGAYYYIFAPAGGVQQGWQTVLRAKDVLGPYEERIVLHQGSSGINGPHQGAWIDTPSGESWFVHFQDRGPYGRIVHLQPLSWENRWPVIGADRDGDGTGEPVAGWKKPYVGKTYPITVPQTTDEFDSATMGLQWQWEANSEPGWSSLTQRPGFIRLYAETQPDTANNLWQCSNLFMQKFPAPGCSVTASMSAENLQIGQEAGLIVAGLDYSTLSLTSTGSGFMLQQVVCHDADKHTIPQRGETLPTGIAQLQLRVTVDTAATCTFSYSEDGAEFHRYGVSFKAREGKWIGSKIGLFCVGTTPTQPRGFVDIDWFRIHK